MARPPGQRPTAQARASLRVVVLGEWEAMVPSLKSQEGALRIRCRVVLTFEKLGDHSYIVVGKIEGERVGAGLCPQHLSALLLTDDLKASGAKPGAGRFH